MTQPLNNQEETLYEDDDLFDNLSEDDYVFVMDSEGNLKTVMLPESFDLDDMPDNIQQALKLFGIGKLETRTLH